MNDDRDDEPTSAAPAGENANETPLQRALRLKRAATDAKAGPPRGGRFQREQAARIAAGKSRPWMSK